MAIQYINTGTAPNQGNGDTLRTAFTKINTNFKLIENLEGFAPATTSTIGAVMIGAGITVNTLTGLISAFTGDYTNLQNIPQALGITDSPTFNNLLVINELSVGVPIGTPPINTKINVTYDTDAYTQTLFQNFNSGAGATTDLIIPNDAGTWDSNMLDIGINSSNYVESEFSLQTPGSAYMFTNGVDLFVGTQSPGTKLYFHAGGTTTSDSGGFLDAYAWNFNRSVNTIVATPGALNFTVQNTSADAAATAIYQAKNEVGATLIMGVTSSYYNGIPADPLGPNEAFIRTNNTGETMHIGGTSNLQFYAASEGTPHYGLPALTLSHHGVDAILDRNWIPFDSEEYDLGSLNATWRSLYLSTGTIYMGGIAIQMNTSTRQLTVDGIVIGESTPPNILTSGTYTVSLSSIGELSMLNGTTFSNSTASVVFNMTDAIVSEILTYSTTSTDQLVVGQYGITTTINAPFTVTEFVTSPVATLLIGDILSGPGYSIPSNIVYVGTGTWTSVVITNTDLSTAPPITHPLPATEVTIARPTTTLAFDIQSPNNTSILVNPGTSGNVIINQDVIPFENNVQSLGSTLNRWKHIWLGGGSIFMKDEIANIDVGITAKNNLLTILGSTGLSIGEFVLQDNTIKIANKSRDIIIGESTATGYVQFNRPVRMKNNVNDTSFEVNRNGYTSIHATPSLLSSVLTIVGSDNRDVQPISNTGSMLHITGKEGISANVTVDAYNSFANWSTRRANGTPTTSTQVTNNQLLSRIIATAYGSNGYVTDGAHIDWVASETTTAGASGNKIEIWTTPKGTASAIRVVTIDSTGTSINTSTGGINFFDGSRQTTAFTGTVSASNITGLNAAAVTSISIGTGLSGNTGPGVASINNTGVLDVQGAVNQIYVNGVTSSTNGHIILSLPQNIATTSNVTFNDINITGTLNFLSTGTVLIPNTVEGATLYLGFTSTNASQIDGGGILLGNTSTGIQSILWNRTNNYWDFNGSGINTQELIATTSTLSSLKVDDVAMFGHTHFNYKFSAAAVQVDSNANAYSQVVHKNHSNGTNASAGFTSFNNTGTDGASYITTGIVSSNFTDPNFTTLLPNDGYMFNYSGNLVIGTQTSNNVIKFHTGGGNIDKIRVIINDNGLTVINTATAAQFVGPLVGDVTGSISGNAESVTNGVYITENYINPNWITSIAGSKVTGIVPQASTVTNGIYLTDTGSVTNTMLAGNIANNKLANNQITINAGTGINVSVASPSLGGNTTISNTGVTTITAGTATNVSTSTGNVVIWASIPIGYTGSTGAGYTGSQGTIGYTGSTGYTGSIGFVGSQGTTGSFSGSTSTQILFTNSTVSTSTTTGALVVSGGIASGDGITIGGSLKYTTATNNVLSVTQLTNKSTPVTANGRTGRIIMHAAALAGAAYVTFTVNNTFIKNSTDVVIVNIQNPITLPNNYLVTVSGVSTNSFNITLYNADTGGGSSHSDAVVLNFAVINVG